MKRTNAALRRGRINAEFKRRKLTPAQKARTKRFQLRMRKERAIYKRLNRLEEQKIRLMANGMKLIAQAHAIELKAKLMLKSLAKR